MCVIAAVAENLCYGRVLSRHRWLMDVRMAHNFNEEGPSLYGVPLILTEGMCSVREE